MLPQRNELRASPLGRGPWRQPLRNGQFLNRLEGPAGHNRVFTVPAVQTAKKDIIADPIFDQSAATTWAFEPWALNAFLFSDSCAPWPVRSGYFSSNEVV